MAFLSPLCRTFAHRSAAVSWAKHREVVLEDPSALTRVQHGAPTLAELIRWYIDTFETISKWQRSKQAHLELLERHALGKCNALTLTSAALIDHVRSRCAKGAGPATVANDLIWTGVVLRAARSVRELPERPEIVREARNACAELRLIGKARKRARRPTPGELEQLRDYFAHRDKRSRIPMLTVLEFALASGSPPKGDCACSRNPIQGTLRSKLPQFLFQRMHRESVRSRAGAGYGLALNM
jgi:hypothetical protein